jgi:colanic acid biosynthesis glycosyl transferase WcaI
MERAKDLDNVHFLPMLSKQEYAELLHASDIGLVTLRAAVQTPVVPSKILSLMAAGRAVVASLPLDGDAPGLIREAQCGVCVRPEEPAELARVLKEMASDSGALSAFGRNGRAYAENHLTLKACVSGYEKIFRTLSRQPHEEQIWPNT